MIKPAIKLVTLTMFLMALIAAPPVIPAYAAGGGGGGGGGAGEDLMHPSPPPVPGTKATRSTRTTRTTPKAKKGPRLPKPKEAAAKADRKRTSVGQWLWQALDVMIYGVSRSLAVVRYQAVWPRVMGLRPIQIGQRALENDG